MRRNKSKPERAQWVKTHQLIHRHAHVQPQCGPQTGHRAGKTSAKQTTQESVAGANIYANTHSRDTQPLCVHQNNRANTSTNRQHPNLSNLHIGKPPESPRGCCRIPLTSWCFQTPSVIRHRPSRPSPSDPTAVPIPPTSTTVATPGSEVTTTCPNGVPAPGTE